MKVSQVLHKMDRDEVVRIFDSTKPIDRFLLYEGTVRGMHRDNPLLPRRIEMIMADGDIIVLDIGHTKSRKGERRWQS